MVNKTTSKITSAIPWTLLVVISFFVLLVIAFQPDQLTSLDEESVPGVEWQTTYDEMARTQITSYQSDISNTEYYDYENKVIANVARNIALESDSSLEAIEKTAEYVYENTQYVWGESDIACMSGTAPKILSSGAGQCDTQSITVIAILRKMGVAAKPVGGCVGKNPDKLLQAFLLNSFTPLKTPIVEPISLDENATPSLSRGMAPGGLHAWVVAWVPGEGWIPIESTSGQIANTEVYNYHVELFPEDDTREDICVSKNANYAKACYEGDYSTMDREGLGLMQEVTVQ